MEAEESLSNPEHNVLANRVPGMNIYIYSCIRKLKYVLKENLTI